MVLLLNETKYLTLGILYVYEETSGEKSVRGNVKEIHEGNCQFLAELYNMTIC